MREAERAAALARLETDGLVTRRDGRLRTTRRWQGALARAALELQQAGAPWRDLRLPLAAALLILHPERSDAETADEIEVLLPLEEVGEAPAQR
ncbi:MAG: hypothetical protein QM767_05895 [Anaeromyxobacter sp.]